MISHPMRRDSSGNLVTIPDHSPRAAAELAGHVVSCLRGERGLAPDYGVQDMGLGDISPGLVAGAIALCEPELAVNSVTVDPVVDEQVQVRVDVDWSQV